jgi:UDP-N-acetylglucosamine 2-epimerase
MTMLKNAILLITVSGGVQKEDFYSNIQCLAVREETEWPETIKFGFNKLVSPKHIPLILNGWSCSDIQKMKRPEEQIDCASKNKVMYVKLKKYFLKLKDDDWYLYKGDEPSNVSFF